jgi:hypothetical protein
MKILLRGASVALSRLRAANFVVERHSPLGRAADAEFPTAIFMPSSVRQQHFVRV